jgi:membrane-associated phospholipid phosphatase
MVPRQHGIAPDGGPRPMVARLAVPIGLFAVFAVIVAIVVRFTAPPAIDVDVLRWWEARRTAALTGIFRFITTVGSPTGLAVTMALAAGALSVRRRSWWPIAVGGAALVGAELLGTTMKVLVGRARPLVADRVPGVSALGLDFPSGHTTQSAACYAILALMVTATWSNRRARVLVYAAAAVGTGLVGVSRLYLGVHWFSDVVASWILGSAWALLIWVLAGWLLARFKHARPASAPPGQPLEAA